jgi:uncharacterized protein (TIGR03437 family)
MTSLIAVALSAVVVVSAADLRTGFYRGHRVVFENMNGVAVIQGDIVIGQTRAIEQGSRRSPAPAARTEAPGGVQLWPNGIVPYTIDSSISSALEQRVLAAIEHWNTRTPIQLIPRVAQTDYVTFTTGDDVNACASVVGRLGGEQKVYLPETCTTGDVIHEIGHVVGLWHEQERSDRNRYVTILYENIDDQYIANFDQRTPGTAEVGPYDYNSIMQYGAYDFSRDNTSPTIETVPAGIPIGQRVGLSEGDIALVRQLYGFPSQGTTIATTPSGLPVMVDGVMANDGDVFDWAPGSKHTIAPIQCVQVSSTVRYVFGSWSDGGAATHSVIASSAQPVLILNYVRQRRLDASVEPAGSGSILVDPASPDGYYTERSYVKITAQPAAGFNFFNWSLTPSSGANPKQVLVNEPLDITATFTTSAVTTIRSDPPGQTILVDGIPATTPRNFVWNVGERHSLAPVESTEGGVRYRFKAWDDGGPEVDTVSASGSTAQYTAEFSPQFRLTTYATIGLNTAPSSPDGYYDQGSQILLTGVPDASDAAVAWSGDLSGALNPVLLTMDREKVIWAAQAADTIEVVNAASLDDGPIAPGEIVTMYLPGADASTIVSPLGKDAATGATVLFNGLPGQILYASGSQLSVLVPPILQGDSTATISIHWNGSSLTAVSPVSDATPALFTANGSGGGEASATNADGSINTPANPVPRGQCLSLNATGLGSLAGDPGIQVRIAGKVAPVTGIATTAAGLAQVKLCVPDDVPEGAAIPVYLIAGEWISPPGVSIAIQ